MILMIQPELVIRFRHYPTHRVNVEPYSGIYSHSNLNEISLAKLKKNVTDYSVATRLGSHWCIHPLSS